MVRSQKYSVFELAQRPMLFGWQGDKRLAHHGFDDTTMDSFLADAPENLLNERINDLLQVECPDANMYKQGVFKISSSELRR
jgi:hypothetical protein